MPSLASCMMEGLLLVVLCCVGLCCMASCCAHHHHPLLIMPHGGCWLVLESVIVGCHLLPIVALPLLCRIVIVCHITLLSFLSPYCCHSHHSHFPILTALIIPCFHPTSSCSWQWLGVLCGGGCCQWWPLSSWPSLFVLGHSMFIWCVEGVWSVIASCWKHKR